MGTPLVVDVHALVLPARVAESADYPEPPRPGDGADLHEHWRTGQVANPSSVHPDLRSRHVVIGPSLDPVIVVVHADDGSVGIAQTQGGAAVAALVELHLRTFVIGQQVTAHRTCLDRMLRGSIHYGRRGLAMHAVAGIDLALWDLHGQVEQTPVWALLGAAQPHTPEAYGTGSRPAASVSLGFAGAKIPVSWAPAHGAPGRRANAELLAQARASVPVDFPLMADLWMSSREDDVVELGSVAAELGYRWLEEPLLPDDLDGLARLRARLPRSLALAAGEHEHRLADLLALVHHGVSVVQPDPMWCGGLTPLLDMVPAVTAAGARLVPHMGGAYSAHLAAARPSVDLVEIAMVSESGTGWVGQHWGLIGDLPPEGGCSRVSTAPGFGLTLDPSAGFVRVAWPRQ